MSTKVSKIIKAPMLSEIEALKLELEKILTIEITHRENHSI
jgi:hypothetical protein